MLYKHGVAAELPFLGCSFASVGFCSHVSKKPNLKVRLRPRLEEIVVTATAERKVFNPSDEHTAITEVFYRIARRRNSTTRARSPIYPSAILRRSTAGLASSWQVATRGIAVMARQLTLMIRLSPSRSIRAQ